MVGFVDGGATVERREKFAVLVGEQQLGALAEPGQRRRNQGFTMGAEVAPVIFVFMVQHHAIRQPGIPQGTGTVEVATAAVLAVTIGRAARRQGVIALGQLPLHNGKRPAITGNMVQAQRQDMPLGGQTNNTAA